MKGLKLYVTAGILAATPAIASSQSPMGTNQGGTVGHRLSDFPASHEDRAEMWLQPEGAIRPVERCKAMLTIGSLEERLNALSELAAFDDGDAFRSLQTALDGELSAASLSDANLVRCAAANALAMSPYPHARTYLRRFEDDPLPAIRLTVLQMIGAKNPRTAADLLFLRRKTIDPDPQVSAEATRLLRERDV